MPNQTTECFRITSRPCLISDGKPDQIWLPRQPIRIIPTGCAYRIPFG